MLTITRRTTTIRPTISCSRSPAWKAINTTAQFYSNKRFSPKPLPEIFIQDWTNFQSLSLGCKPGTKIFQLCFALALHLRYSFFLALTVVMFHLTENSHWLFQSNGKHPSCKNGRKFKLCTYLRSEAQPHINSENGWAAVEGRREGRHKSSHHNSHHQTYQSNRKHIQNQPEEKQGNITIR